MLVRIILASALGLCACATAVPAGSPAEAPIDLRFEDISLRSGSELAPTPRLMEAAGKRVRLRGFMAHLETPPASGFYLTRAPVECHDAGGVTNDLPLDSVRVKVVAPNAPKQELPYLVRFVPGPIEVIGVLEVGNEDEPDGTLSRVRVLLTPPATSARQVAPTL